jgi:hypothetical protein
MLNFEHISGNSYYQVYPVRILDLPTIFSDNGPMKGKDWCLWLIGCSNTWTVHSYSVTCLCWFVFLFQHMLKGRKDLSTDSPGDLCHSETPTSRMEIPTIDDIQSYLSRAWWVKAGILIPLWQGSVFKTYLHRLEFNLIHLVARHDKLVVRNDKLNLRLGADGQIYDML